MLVYFRRESGVSVDERIYNMSQGELIFHKPLEFQ